MDLTSIGGRTAEIAGIPVVLVPDGMKVEMRPDILDERIKRDAAPVRIKGAATHQELESFVQHVNRFKDAASVIWAEINGPKLTAVLNYHVGNPEPGAAAGGPTPGSPRWGDHRAVYTCPLSQRWKLWLASSGKSMSQEEFADFIDANLRDVASPAQGAPGYESMPQPASLLDMARKLTIHTKGDFQRQINETTGEYTLVNKLEHTEGSTKIPRAFLVQLAVFEGGTLYAVEARVRFVLDNGRPRFSYHLYETDLILRDAFKAVRDQVLAQTGLPVFAGEPEQTK
jgi:uncharacterized protein YfdQ (DUF2303 family)